LKTKPCQNISKPWLNISKRNGNFRDYAVRNKSPANIIWKIHKEIHHFCHSGEQKGWPRKHEALNSKPTLQEKKINPKERRMSFPNFPHCNIQMATF
jgi:hypothetical protein